MKKINKVVLLFGCFIVPGVSSIATADQSHVESENCEVKSDPATNDTKVKDQAPVNRAGYRANPFPNTPSYAQGGDTSRYATDQGWARGRNFWWGGRRGSDIPTSGYTTPSRR